VWLSELFKERAAHISRQRWRKFITTITPTLIITKGAPKVAVIGVAEWGHAHLRCEGSGVDVVVGLREANPKRSGEANGLTVKSVADAAKKPT